MFGRIFSCMGWKSKIGIAAISAWVALVSPAIAASPESQPLRLPDPSAGKPPVVESGGMFVKTLLALAFTLLVIWVVYKLMKRLNFRTRSSGSGPAVEVLSRTQLDKEMSVYVLRLGNQVSVVSRSGSGSSLIRQMSQEEAEGSGLLASVNPSDQRVKTVLSEIKSRLRPAPPLPPEQVDLLLGDTQNLTVDQLLSEESVWSVNDLLEREK